MIELNGAFQVFFGGVLGPVLVELVKLASSPYTGMTRTRYRRWSYWIPTVALLIVSGAVTVIQGVEHVTLLRAVQLGINAPLLVAAWANHTVAKQNQQAIERFMPPMPRESDDSFITRIANSLSW